MQKVKLTGHIPEKTSETLPPACAGGARGSNGQIYCG